MKKIKNYLFLICLLISTISIAQEKYFLDENIDYTINPAEDFFMYANGNFIKRNPIPASESTYGIFNLVEDSVYVYLQRICEYAMNDPSARIGSNSDKIGNFYFSGLDTENIEKKGLEPLNEWLNKINGIKNKSDLSKVLSEMHYYGMSPLFSAFIGQDLMISSSNKIYLYQGGLGLPDRDYYFNTDSRTKNIREKYVSHIGNLMELIGEKKNTSKIIYF